MVIISKLKVTKRISTKIILGFENGHKRVGATVCNFVIRQSPLKMKRNVASNQYQQDNRMILHTFYLIPSNVQKLSMCGGGGVEESMPANKTSHNGVLQWILIWLCSLRENFIKNDGVYVTFKHRNRSVRKKKHPQHVMGVAHRPNIEVRSETFLDVCRLLSTTRYVHSINVHDVFRITWMVYKPICHI